MRATVLKAKFESVWHQAIGFEELQEFQPSDNEPLNHDEIVAICNSLRAMTQEKEGERQALQLQWAADQLVTRLEGLPADIQICVLGWLASWAQHLRSVLKDDVEPRLALDRLHRYRVTADLPQVSALLPTPQSERGGWTNDVASWRGLLDL